MPVSQPKSRTRTADVKEVLLGWIRQGKYPPGSALPSVPELVSRLGVSRTVVREALQSLVGMNFVDMRPGIGTYVRSIPPELIVNADVMAALIDLETLIKVALARKAIEGAVARLAATEATSDDMDEIEAELDRIGRTARKNLPMHAVTPEFHNAIARATHNDVLVSVVTSFNSLMVAAGSVIEQQEIGVQYRLGEHKSHAELLQVLQTRNPANAQVVMESHIQKTVDLLEQVRGRRAPSTSCLCFKAYR